ncbi:MAG: flagellar hook-length control protein FliK [Planctomycetota bacterium]
MSFTQFSTTSIQASPGFAQTVSPPSNFLSTQNISAAPSDSSFVINLVSDNTVIETESVVSTNDLALGQLGQPSELGTKPLIVQPPETTIQPSIYQDSGNFSKTQPSQELNPQTTQQFAKFESTAPKNPAFPGTSQHQNLNPGTTLESTDQQKLRSGTTLDTLQQSANQITASVENVQNTERAQNEKTSLQLKTQNQIRNEIDRSPPRPIEDQPQQNSEPRVDESGQEDARFNTVLETNAIQNNKESKNINNESSKSRAGKVDGAASHFARRKAKGKEFEVSEEFVPHLAGQLVDESLLTTGELKTEALNPESESTTTPSTSVLPVQYATSNLSSSIASSDAVENSTSRKVATQTANAIRNDLIPLDQNGLKSISIQVDPPELGVIHIQVELVADQVHAQIVASEWASAELLSREKEMLNVALADSGLGNTQVDISFGSDSSEYNQSDSSKDSTNGSKQNLKAVETVEIAKTDGLGNVQMVGVNLIA